MQLSPILFLALLSSLTDANIIWRYQRSESEPQRDIDFSEHTWTPLGPAQMQDYYGSHSHVPRSLPEIEKEQQSFRFMEAPVSLSNPVFNVFSKMSDLYRWISNEKRSPIVVY
uniref:Secreted protein n=1 Tax=Caenorhabditis tropicalis TaxID=1561998 RepID=A0A1I7UPD2_9PELO